MQRHGKQTGAAKDRFDNARSLPDLGGSGQEDEHIAVKTFLHQPLQRGRHPILERCSRMRRVLDAQVVAFSLRAQDRAVIEKAGNRRRFHRR